MFLFIDDTEKRGVSCFSDFFVYFSEPVEDLVSALKTDVGSRTECFKCRTNKERTINMACQ